MTSPEQTPGDWIEVAIAVVIDRDSVLIGRRPGSKPLAGMWEFPGGKIQSGETPEVAAIRECREETGLRIEIDSFIETVDHQYDHGRVRLHFFATHPTDENEQLAGGFRWRSINDLAELEFPSANDGVLQWLVDRVCS